MTENKVTSYELSKKLAECGFDSPCDWYWRYGHYQDDIELVTADDRRWLTGYFYKAYDCYDLLMWFTTARPYVRLQHLTGVHFGCYTSDGVSGGDQQPQDALAAAIVKILEGNK